MSTTDSPRRVLQIVALSVASALPMLCYGCQTSQIQSHADKSSDIILSNGLRFAHGKLSEGRMVGRWRYWYDDGRPMMIGDFDQSGKPSGSWLVVDKDGSPVLELAAWYSEPDGCGIWLPGIADFDWRSLSIVDKSTATAYLPSFASGWIGTGEYNESGYKGKLPSVQLTQLLTQLRTN